MKFLEYLLRRKICKYRQCIWKLNFDTLVRMAKNTRHCDFCVYARRFEDSHYGYCNTGCENKNMFIFDYSKFVCGSPRREIKKGGAK